MRALIAVVVVGCSAPAPKVVERAAEPSPSTSPPALVVPAPDPTPPAFRLPGDVAPIRERVELTIVPGQPRVTGAIHVDANVVRPTRVVWLNATALDVHAATLGGRPARVIAKDDVVGLVAGAELPAGPIAIDAAFDAPIDDARARGMYSARDGTDDYVYTFFEPIDARRAFPCFDEPSFKIPWTLVFHVRAADVALGNAAVVHETPEPDGMKRVELAESKPLPSYLVAFVVGPFDIVDDGTAGRASTPIRFVLPKGHRDELGWAKQTTPHVVAALEDYFDMPYPFGKLDVAVVPRYWGTMEHPGLVAMGQPLTLIRPGQETRAREQDYTDILAHELGHYWFGDLVTMAWWDDTWLNEALGEWLDMIITDAVMPGWHYREQRIGLAERAMVSDETLAARPIHRPVTTRDGIQASFDNDSTYFKGASVVRACEAFVGADRWRDFIRGYVRKHAGGNATDRDFVGDMRAALGAPVADAFDTYVSTPGVPLVHVRAECGGDHPHLAIERTRSLPAGATDPAPQAWPVPVCVRSGNASSAQRACTTGATLPVASCPTWIVPNDDATGYYRSVVDPALLSSPGKPTGAERRMIVGDLRSMVARAALPLDRLLAVVPRLAADPDPLVAMAALDATAVRADGLDDATYAAWRGWRHRALGPLARALGWHRAKTDSDEREQLRERVLTAVAEDDPELAHEADGVADAWLADRTHVHRIDDGLANAALAVAAHHGDRARFDRYVAAAKATTNTSDREKIFLGLGSFDAPALAELELELVAGHDVDIRDSYWVLDYANRRRPVRGVLLAFLATHLDAILARLRDDEQDGILADLAGAFCDAPHRAAAAALVTPRAATIEGAELPVTRGLERSADCIAELAREQPAIERLVRKAPVSQVSHRR